jgi:hypothetical protein
MQRDVRSYHNECIFVQHYCNILQQRAGIRMPKTYYANAAMRLDHLKDSRFIIAVEYLSDCTQFATIPQAFVDCTLSWIARFHAYFWGDLNKLHEAASLLWPVGGSWDMGKRKKFASPTENTEMPKKFGRFCDSFAIPETEGGSRILSADSTKRLGQRLAAHAFKIGSILANADLSTKTVIHGDLKQANLFFAVGDATTASTAGVTAATAIDWQWTGVGLGVQDLIYLVRQ